MATSLTCAPVEALSVELRRKQLLEGLLRPGPKVVLLHSRDIKYAHCVSRPELGTGPTNSETSLLQVRTTFLYQHSVMTKTI